MIESKQAPSATWEWLDLLSRLVHIDVGPPEKSHNLTLDAMGIRIIGGSDLSLFEGDTRSEPIYHSADVRVMMDALVTGVNYYPANVPPKEEDVLYPHGRLRLTVDLFLDKPLTTERVDDA